MLALVLVLVLELVPRRLLPLPLLLPSPLLLRKLRCNFRCG